MSKKKAFGGSTMTLKDFHGGSIPPELPLPSAPGVSARPQDRPGLDRAVGGAWGRMDPHRPSRPGSAGASVPRSFDEPSSFLPSAARIGRHFDEDERKPFEASSAPRRVPAPDPEPGRLLINTSSKQQLFGRPGTSPGAVTQGFGGELGFPSVSEKQSSVSPGAPSAWGVRREVAMEPQMQPVSTLTSAAAASRFAQASAMEKISSGRWQSKLATGFGRDADVEVIHFADVDGGSVASKSSSAAYGSGIISEVRSVGRGDERIIYAAPKSPGILEVKGRNGNVDRWYGGSPSGSSEGRHVTLQEDKQLQYLDGRLGDLHVSQRGYPDGLKVRQGEENHVGVHASQLLEKSNVVQEQPEVYPLERPKLKILPRTKSPESSLVHAYDKQEHESKVFDLRASESVDIRADTQFIKSGSAGANEVNQTVERPRLNLKPRSQPVGQLEESLERERKSVFGGARPRELVLKERGIDTDPNSSSPLLPENRAKREHPKGIDGKQDSASSVVLESGKVEFHAVEHRFGKEHEQKDFRVVPAKSDAPWGSRGNDNRRNTREFEKPSERRPEPESWRKPVEDSKPEAPGPRFGKTASALELAQAFSKSASTPDVIKSDTRIAGNPKSVPGRNQVPFSRLTDNREIYSGLGPRKINGY